MKTRTVKVRIVTAYTADVPEGWTNENILFQWGCSDSIEIKHTEELPAEITEEGKTMDEIDEKEQAETIARIAADTLKANSKNSAATAKFCGINPGIGAAYSIEGDENSGQNSANSTYC